MKDILNNLTNTDLGNNVFKLFEKTALITNGVFVDLGVRGGTSSEIMLIDSEKLNNKVFGVDVDFSVLDDKIKNNSNYKCILGDSVTIGKNWTSPINGLFVDTFHIKEQVMMELYYWYPHMVEGGFIAFHDTNWPKGKYDYYGGIMWDRVEEGIKDFFNIKTLNYEDEYIVSNNYPESWGMTIMEIKKKNNYIESYDKWDDVFNKRNHLISLFWNEHNKGDINIELLI